MGQRLFVAIDDSERRRRASPASIGGEENQRGRERALRDAGGYMGGGGHVFLSGDAKVERDDGEQIDGTVTRSGIQGLRVDRPNLGRSTGTYQSPY